MSEEHKKKIGSTNKKRLKKHFSTQKGKLQAQQHSLKMSGRKLSEEHKKKIKNSSPKGIEHFAWKGEKASYSSKHIWVRTILGAPKYCEICKRTDKKKYEWANNDHKYKRRIEDYMRLCTSCHRKYDYKNHLSDKGSGGGTIKNKIVID